MANNPSGREISAIRRKFKKVGDALERDFEMRKKEHDGIITFLGWTVRDVYGRFNLLVSFSEDAHVIHTEVQSVENRVHPSSETSMRLYIHDYQRDRAVSGTICLEMSGRFSWKHTPLWKVMGFSDTLIMEMILASWYAGVEELEDFFDNVGLISDSVPEPPPAVLIAGLKEGGEGE